MINIKKIAQAICTELQFDGFANIPVEVDREFLGEWDEHYSFFSLTMREDLADDSAWIGEDEWMERLVNSVEKRFKFDKTVCVDFVRQSIEFEIYRLNYKDEYEDEDRDVLCVFK